MNNLVLTDLELLTAAIGDHARAEALLDAGGLRELMKQGPGRLGTALYSAFKLYQRAMIEKVTPDLILDSDAAFGLFQAKMQFLDHEELHAVYLDRRGAILAYRELTSGNGTHTIVCPRQILGEALRLNSSMLIIAHNHPSGASEPSDADRLVTTRLLKAAKIFDIQIFDHIVIGANTATSMRENNEYLWK